MNSSGAGRERGGVDGVGGVGVNQSGDGRRGGGGGDGDGNGGRRWGSYSVVGQWYPRAIRTGEAAVPGHQQRMTVQQKGCEVTRKRGLAHHTAGCVPLTCAARDDQLHGVVGHPHIRR